MMFWSRSKQVVHDFTEKTDCFITLEDTLLGSVLDGLSWCGKENSKGVLEKKNKKTKTPPGRNRLGVKVKLLKFFFFFSGLHVCLHAFVTKKDGD